MIGAGRRGLSLTRGALIVAVAWSLVLVVGAFTVPLYRGVQAGGTLAPDGSTGSFGQVVTATLVDVNGPRALIVVGIPLVVSLVVTALLWRSPAPTAARVVAWILTAAVGLVAMAGMLTIGIYLVPTVGALLLACLTQVNGAASAMPRRAG